MPSKGFSEEQSEHIAFETVHDLKFRVPTNHTSKEISCHYQG